MRYELSIHAYDVLDHIRVTVRVRQESGALPDLAEWSTLASGTIAGQGEADVHHWVHDVLTWALEAT